MCVCYNIINIIYNAITLNKREIDRVYKIELYIATVSINQKAVDCIKTALRFRVNATRISARTTVKNKAVCDVNTRHCYGALR